MDFLQLKICLLYLIVLIEGAVVKKRYRRYPTPPPLPTLPSLGLSLDSYTAFLNDSIPITCPNKRVLRRVSLSTDSLHRMLKDKGGVFLPHLMATEEDSANNFKNLLNIDTFSNEDMPDQVFPTTQTATHKSRLEEDLRKWSFITNFLKSANSSDGRNSRKPEKLRDNVRQSNLKGNASSSNTIEHKISNFLVQNNLTLIQLMEYIKAMKMSTHPKVLMTLEQHKDKRIKRNADGSKTTTQYCIKKGSPVKSSLLSLCEECAATTKLPSDRFPRYLNEAICGSDSTCLNIKGRHASTVQGSCLQSEMHLTILRRRPGGCRMMISDGQHVYVDEWETYTQTVRNGCKCAVDKRSILGSSLDLPAPFG